MHLGYCSYPRATECHVLASVDMSMYRRSGLLLLSSSSLVLEASETPISFEPWVSADFGMSVAGLEPVPACVPAAAAAAAPSFGGSAG